MRNNHRCNEDEESNLPSFSECDLSGEEIIRKRREVGSNGDGEKEEKDVAPDGGWGWVVVFGASLILVMVDTVGQCFGIIFSSFLREQEASSVLTAVIFNMFGFLWCLTGPPLGPLVSEFGWRKITFVASIMISLSTITSAFVTAPWLLIFTYSTLGGIGCGIISNISYAIVPYYFSTRRGLANGIIMCWDCGGQLLGPPLIYYLQYKYGFAGATLILGGIVLNCCVGAAVFHPVEWHLKFQICDSQKQENIDKNSDESSQCLSHKVNSSKCQCNMMTNLIRSTIADLRILGSARAIIIAMGATLIFNGYLNFLAIVPFYMQDSGFTLEDSAWCVSVSAMCNMLTRIVVSTLSDTPYFNFRLCYLIASLTIAISMIVFVVISDIMWLSIVMGLWGCGVGAFMSIFNLVMVHYMGLDNFMPMLGATMLFISGGYLTIGPLVGYISDASETYSVTIWVLASTVLLSFLLWLFMPIAVTYDKRESAIRNTGKIS
nr:monocarboxylate transporter 12-like [Procambarus clarkii]